MTAPLNSDLRAQLHAYLDFELSIEQEQQFFSRLAADSDLCGRLHDLRGLRHEALRSGGATTPPPDVTLGLFSTLGIPAATHADRPPIPALAIVQPATRRNRRLAIPVAALLAWSTMIWFASREFTPVNLPSVASIPAAETRTRPPVSPQAHSVQSAPKTDARPTIAGANLKPVVDAPVSDIPVTNAEVIETNRNASPVDLADLAVPAPREAQEVPAAGSPSSLANSSTDSQAPRAQRVEMSDASFDAAIADAAPPAVEMPDVERGESGGRSAVVEASLPRIDASPSLHAPTQTSTLSAQRQGGIAAYDGLTMPAGSTGHLSGLSFELRGFSTATFPSVTVASGSNPWMSDMGIALYYGTGQDAFGAEFGEEPWAQTYNGIENGKAVRYEQNLMTSWFTANYRHTFEELGQSGFEPYASAGVGVTFQRWPLMRAGLGLMYTADRRVRFHAGIDGSVLAYPFQETWFSSRKLGLTYGISVLM
jgi:hypothetical protein